MYLRRPGRVYENSTVLIPAERLSAKRSEKERLKRLFARPGASDSRIPDLPSLDPATVAPAGERDDGADGLAPQERTVIPMARLAFIGAINQANPDGRFTLEGGQWQGVKLSLANGFGATLILKEDEGADVDNGPVAS